MLSADPPSPSDFGRHTSANRSSHEQRPPISVIVLQGNTPCSHSSRRSDPYSPEVGGLTSNKRTGNSPSASSSFINSGAFRLQPRNLKSIPSPSAGADDARGKKRRANSLNDESPLSSTFRSGASDTATALTHTTTKGSPLTSTSPPTEQAFANFQGLSLQSPVSATYQRAGIQALTESPLSLVGSQSHRSSFLRYNSASPISYAAGTSPGSGSLMSKSPSLSPKRAPCTVLFGQSTSAAEPARSVRTSSPGTLSKRPPLHCGLSSHLMQSLDDCSAKGPYVQDVQVEHVHMTREPPLATIHCHQSGLLASPASHDSKLTDCATYMTFSNFQSTPCSKQSRTHDMDSPSRRSILSPSHQTPLPRLTLTPRSADSQRQRTSELPIFPMDLDTDTSWAASSLPGIQTPPSIVRQESQTRGSFFPLPDWKESMASESIMHRVSHSRSMSLLKPAQASSADPLEMIIASSGPPSTFYDHDNDSLSASDDEDDFFLAAPSVIQEEKKATFQMSKQRKIEGASEMPPRRMPSGHSLRSGLASNTSLLGMDFVTSSSNLQNMDRVSSNLYSLTSFDELSNLNHQDLVGADYQVKRDEESPDSVGLALESSQPSDLLQVFPQVGDRDLTTPPVVVSTQSASPPPLLQGSSHTPDSVNYLLTTR